MAMILLNGIEDLKKICIKWSSVNSVFAIQAWEPELDFPEATLNQSQYSFIRLLLTNLFMLFCQFDTKLDIWEREILIEKNTSI